LAIKYYCDACGMEIEGRIFEFNYLCHIENENNLHGYIDTKSHEPISGRSCKKDLCLSCYNKIFYKAYEVYKNIK
jgi:hypothetical protein